MGGDKNIIFSALVEIGPVLFIKEISRMISKKKIEYGLLEFIKAAIFAIPGKRIPNANNGGYDGFGSHKGFDFRAAIRFIETKGYNVTILGYGPLPIKTWIGNSQVFFKAEKYKAICPPPNQNS